MSSSARFVVGNPSSGAEALDLAMRILGGCATPPVTTRVEAETFGSGGLMRDPSLFRDARLTFTGKGRAGQYFPDAHYDSAWQTGDDDVFRSLYPDRFLLTLRTSAMQHGPAVLPPLEALILHGWIETERAATELLCDLLQRWEREHPSRNGQEGWRPDEVRGDAPAPVVCAGVSLGYRGAICRWTRYEPNALTIPLRDRSVASALAMPGLWDAAEPIIVSGSTNVNDAPHIAATPGFRVVASWSDVTADFIERAIRGLGEDALEIEWDCLSWFQQVQAGGNGITIQLNCIEHDMDEREHSPGLVELLLDVNVKATGDLSAAQLAAHIGERSGVEIHAA